MKRDTSSIKLNQPFSTMPVPRLRVARPAGWITCYSICASTMPRAWRTAKGSTHMTKHFAHLGILFIYECTVSLSKHSKLTWTRFGLSATMQLSAHPSEAALSQAAPSSEQQLIGSSGLVLAAVVQEKRPQGKRSWSKQRVRFGSCKVKKRYNESDIELIRVVN